MSIKERIEIFIERIPDKIKLGINLNFFGLVFSGVIGLAIYHFFPFFILCIYIGFVTALALMGNIIILGD